MSLGVINRDGGRTDEAGHIRTVMKMIAGEVITGMKVVQRAAGANMSVDVGIGDAKIVQSDYAHGVFVDAAYNVVITTANGSNPRKDIIVAYVDRGQARSTGVANNTNGVLKIVAVAGTPAGSPADPSDPTIQTAVGAGNPFIKLARVLVGTSVTSITNSNITDIRVMAGAIEDPVTGFPLLFRQQFIPFFERSGCVWSGDAYASTRNASMTAGYVWINGKRLSVALVSARTFTASKDTYVDASDNLDGTALLTYTEVANNAASPALASGSVRMAIIVTGASNIANVGSINQGQIGKLLPIASSTPYMVTDSLGNMICNRDPHPTMIGYREITSTFTTPANSTTAVQATGLSVPVIIPAGYKIKVTAWSGYVTSSGSPKVTDFEIWDGTPGSGTRKAGATVLSNVNGNASAIPVEANLDSISGLKTYNVGVTSESGGFTSSVRASATSPAFIKVELVQ